MSAHPTPHRRRRRRRIYVRRDVWCLESATTWDAISLAYAYAVADMQSRPVTDPTSWTFQAGIHGSYAPPPAGAAWNQCQHRSWFFLSWHRMYLYWFERIVRATVIKLLGRRHRRWALPYWNYNNGYPTNTLPPAFRQPTLPDGTPNALYVADPGRNTSPPPGINGGAQVPPWATSFATAFADANFLPPPYPGFGGGQSPPVHFGSATGDLENVPHNVIHGLVGGPGLMGDPNRAAQDPIFWLHHANIDRLWSHWIELGSGRADPRDPLWLTPGFPFYDENGSAVSMSSQDVLDTVTQLHYRYEDEAPPVVYAPIHIPRRLEREVKPPTPEVLAESKEPIELSGPAHASMTLDEEGWRMLGELDPNQPGRPVIQLWVEGIEFTENPGVVYEIFLNLPVGNGEEEEDDENDEDEESGEEEARREHRVGFVTFFGGTHHHAQMPGETEAQGMTEVFTLNNLLVRMKDSREFEERRIEFDFEPLGLLPPPKEGVTTRIKVQPAAKATIRRLRVTAT